MSKLNKFVRYFFRKRLKFKIKEKKKIAILRIELSIAQIEFTWNNAAFS